MRDVFESALEKMFTDHIAVETVLAAESEGWLPGLWTIIEDSGFALASAPEDLGGAGASWDDLFSVLLLCGRFSLPLPLPEALLGNWVLGKSGIPALGVSMSVAADADLVWEGDVLSGTLPQVPWGRHVTQVVAIVAGKKTSGEEKADEEPRVVVLETALCLEQRLSTNTAGEPRDDLVFEKVTPLVSAPLANTLECDALRRGGALLRAAQMAGALQELMRLSSHYVNERVQFGKPIAKFQVVQHQLAVLAEHVAAARVSAEAACVESTDSLAILPVMAAKICASEAAGIGASSGHAVHGAIGFTHEYSLHLLTRRLWSWRSEYGSATHWSDELGRAVCKAGAAQYWPTITTGVLSQ
jgi:acyl-CoA dehydrogenase|tara:strand:+ start:17461 stop:18531 length:1071 start_codon:yes stop_codon:yes gene_type:complete